MRIIYTALLAISLFSLFEVNAQSRAATFSFSYRTLADYSDFGPQLTDGEGGTSDVPGVTYQLFYSNAAGVADGTVRFYGYGNHSGDDNTVYLDGREGYIYPIGQEGGTPAYQFVLQTADGTEFSFKSIYLMNYGGATASQQTLEVVGYRNGTVTGQITTHADNAQFGLLLNGSNFLTPSIFQNVDRVVIRPTATSGFPTEFWYGLNDIVVDNAVSSVLPVHLLSFSASKAAAGSVLLSWKAAGEKETSHFIVERSDDGRTFVPIGRVNVKGSGDVTTYMFEDTHPTPGRNFYRLRQLDFNGSFSFSAIKTAESNFRQQVLVYPNPALSSMPIKIKSNLSGPAQLHLTNAAGQNVFGRNYSADDIILIPASSLIPGIYYVTIKATSWVQTTTIVVQ